MLNFFMILGLVIGTYADLLLLSAPPLVLVGDFASLAITILCLVLVQLGRITRTVNIGINLCIVVYNFTITALVNAFNHVPSEYGMIAMIINTAMGGLAAFLINRWMALVFGLFNFALLTVITFLSSAPYLRGNYPVIALVILAFTMVLYYYRGFVTLLSYRNTMSKIDLERTNDDLRRLMDQAEKINQANRPFVVFGRNTLGLAHDFKNDLAVLASGKELLAMKIDHGLPINMDDLVSLEEGLKRINYRIDIVKYIASTNSESPPEQVKLKDFIDMAIYPFRITEEIRTFIHFHTYVDDDGIAIWGSRYRLLQIIENIVRNSCEAIMEGNLEGRGNVHIRAWQTGERVHIAIEDDGPGMAGCFDCESLDCMDCIHFELGRTTKTTGSGIGMTNVIQGLKVLRGEMQILSKKGQGCRTILSFPSDKAALAGQVHQAHPAG